ncbi:MAG: cupin domain-containing protein [Alphaproteobacteria bacterium]|nr:cupin domain-containing protein [Alphaproteobacteria bacterium]
MRLADDPDVIAPDGSEVRILCATAAGSMAHFTLPPGGISIAVAHRTIDEVWYFISGQGRMWRQDDDGEDIVEVEPGIAITIPLGARFQFRCDGDEPLTAVAIAMPPWPGADEAFAVEGPWQPNV